MLELEKIVVYIILSPLLFTQWVVSEAERLTDHLNSFGGAEMEIFLNKVHFIISSKQIDSLQMNLIRTAHTQGNGNSPLKIMF